jgi:hypothetical protein
VSGTKCLRNFPSDQFLSKTIFISSDIEVLKKKKLKIEIELATDDKNKETIANQIRLLTEKLEEIDSKQQQKRNALAKIDDTLTQSEIGKELMNSTNVLLQQSSYPFRLLKNHRFASGSSKLCRIKD